MKIILFLMLAVSAPRDSLVLMFWNLENFFDFRDTGQSVSDREFSSGGERHWTSARFHSKCSGVAKTILWIAQHEGELPDVVGFAEVENAYVLRSIRNATLLRKTDYACIHFESPDPRGIDVAMLYRRSRLKMVSARPCRVGDFRTRDILEARFILPGGDSLAVMFCHLPSKYSGKSSDGRRKAAVERLVAASDSLDAEGWANQAVLGDFNAAPDEDVFLPLEARFRVVMAVSGPGTIKFNGRWETIDRAYIRGTGAHAAESSVASPSFLRTKDSAYGGTKPLRTYSGPKYLGGISDHYPIILRMNY